MINAVSNPVPISNSKRSFMDTLWFLFWHVYRLANGHREWHLKRLSTGLCAN
ncbi:hypothetical protein D3C78_1589090 [compost metagenome]